MGLSEIPSDKSDCCWISSQGHQHPLIPTPPVSGITRRCLTGICLSPLSTEPERILIISNIRVFEGAWRVAAAALSSHSTSPLQTLDWAPAIHLGFWPLLYDSCPYSASLSLIADKPVASQQPFSQCCVSSCTRLTDIPVCSLTPSWRSSLRRVTPTPVMFGGSHTPLQKRPGPSLVHLLIHPDSCPRDTQPHMNNIHLIHTY